MPSAKPNVRVTVTEDGPYLVTGDVPIARQTIMADAEGGSETWFEGEAVAHRASYMLCRCGASKTKPFCDGSHAEIGFDGAETASREPYLDQAKGMEGPVLGLTDVEILCAFARFCDPHGQVWNLVNETDNPAAKKNFVRQVGDFPSGRLVAWDNSSGKAIEPAHEPSIGLIEDPANQCAGPIWLRGGVQVIGSDG